jgi:hypothetical protein
MNAGSSGALDKDVAVFGRDVAVSDREIALFDFLVPARRRLESFSSSTLDAGSAAGI